VPDFYQGTELWDLSLVDPDNRRPVDYAVRARLLEEVTPREGGEAELATSLVAGRIHGRIKLFATARALRARASMARVFADGSYEPLGTSGNGRESVFAFARRHDSGLAITCVPRLIVGVLGNDTRPPLGPDVWKDTRIELPDSFGVPTLRDVFTGTSIQPRQTGEGTVVDAHAVFAQFPISLMVTRSC
jgi:(1->4)-alpha-D-glucan 1-alpha-D-glucosylmutase